MITTIDVKEAQERIKDMVKHTNLEYSFFLSELTGHRIFYKTENMQYSYSFKARGASNFILQLDPKIAQRGVTTASSGNHGQAVAYAASKIGCPCIVVVPLGAVEAKVQAIKDFGAEVVYYGTNSEERAKKAREIAEQRKMSFIHSCNDEKVISGQGTIGLEILDDFPEVEIIIVPIGGGGLISGILSSVKENKPKIKVYGVEPTESNSMYVSLKRGRITELPETKTIADGLRSNQPGDLTYEIVNKFIDDIFLVSENEILEATKTLLLKDKLLAEPSGAAATAAIIAKKIPEKNKKIVSIISGGNVNLQFIKKLLD